MTDTYDFGDGHGLVPAHKHGNGDGWVGGDSFVSYTAYVGADALVFGNALVFGWSEISENARVFGNAIVSENAKVLGNARVYENSQVQDSAKVYGDAQVYGNAKVLGNARVSGYAWVYGDAKVYSDAWVSGYARILSEFPLMSTAATSSNVMHTSPWERAADNTIDREEYEVKYLKSEARRGAAGDVTKFMTLYQAKEYLADLKKDGIDGSISRGGNPVEESWEGDENMNTEIKIVDRFDLEQDIFKCWHIVDDIDQLSEMIMDRGADTDTISNILIGLSALYGDRFQRLMDNFEEIIASGKI